MTLSAESATERMRKALADREPDCALTQLGDPGTPPRVDRLRCLSLIYELHLGKFEQPSWPQHHPVVARWKWVLEQQWLDELAADDTERRAQLPSDPIAALRALAARDRLPAVYTWVAKHADHAGIVRFLSLEGGPDAGFDDLVAICQLGLPARAKMELATNYWDEMGNGDLRAVHTYLHERLSDALQLEPIDDESALARSALLGLLVTNRTLQPELLGALGLIELQAGPRSRLVVQGLARIGAPEEAMAFYEVHAEVDPRHGQDWLDNAITPMLDEYPGIGERIVRGAMWRSYTNAELFSGAAVAAVMASSMEVATA
jgi:hypothetical protein